MMVLIVKCSRCGNQLVVVVGEDGLEAELCSICSAPGSELMVVGSFEEMAPDQELIAEVLGIVA